MRSVIMSENNIHINTLKDPGNIQLDPIWGYTPIMHTFPRQLSSSAFAAASASASLRSRSSLKAASDNETTLDKQSV